MKVDILLTKFNLEIYEEIITKSRNSEIPKYVVLKETEMWLKKKRSNIKI